MRLIYITAALPFGQHEESFFIPELSEILSRGHKILLVPRYGRGNVDEKLKDLSLDIAENRIFSWRIFMYASLEMIRSPWKIACVAKEIILCGSFPTRIKNLIVFPKGLYVAHLAKQWSADHIHAQWASTMATIGWIAHELSGVPWSFTAHRGDIVSSNLFFAKAGSAKLVRFISESGMALAENIRCESSEYKKRVIHMGVELPLNSSPLHVHTSVKCILCAANLIPVKGHKYLIHALRILNDRGIECRLSLAGRGCLESELKRQVQAFGLKDRVRFLGQLRHSDLLALYRAGQIDLFVLASIDIGRGIHEGIPVSLLEAMAHRIPVIATSTGGIPEILEGGAGIMVPHSDAAALADAIRRILNDEKLWMELSQKGRMRIEQAFNVKQTTGEFLACIDPQNAEKVKK